MAEKRIRPTWDLSGNPHPATFPAAMLDPDEATRDALAIDKRYSRMEDVSDLAAAAISYAAETMRNAIAEFALQVIEQPEGSTISNSEGWTALYEPGPSRSVIDMTLTHPVHPGGWLVSIHFEPEMTDEARERHDELYRTMNEEDQAKGLSVEESVLGRMFPNGDLSEAQQAYNRLESDPDSYRPARRGDNLTAVTSTALELRAGGWRGLGVAGKIEGVEYHEKADSYLPLKSHPDIWWRAMELNMAPVSRYDRDGSMLSPANEKSDASAHLTLEILSDFIVSLDLADMVSQLDETTSKKSWITYGEEESAIVDEAGHAYVHAAGGLFDRSVTERIRDFSAGIAAHDVSRYFDELVELAPRMAEQGFDAKNTYDCNDGRDICHATVEGNIQTFYVQTQQGKYEARIEIGPDGKAERLDACRTTGIPGPVGRFVRQGERMVADYRGRDGVDEIPYRIREIKDMNGIISSLSSVSFVFEEEFGKAGQPTP